MKTQSSIFVIITILVGFLISCKSDNGNENEIDSIQIRDTNFTVTISDTATITTDIVQVNEENKKIVSKYICPLGDIEGNKDEPGICPICEMELIENPDYISKNSKK